MCKWIGWTWDDLQAVPLEVYDELLAMMREAEQDEHEN